MYYNNTYANRKSNYDFCIKNPILGSRLNTIRYIMIYQDLIKIVGQYITYAEFIRDNPEVEISQFDWYSMLDGQTMRENKSALKQRYLQDFDDDWSYRRKMALRIIKNEASN